MFDQKVQKKNAGEKAAELIEDGMLIGLGTGSTVYYTILKIGKLVKDGLKIEAVSTSSETSRLAKTLGINILSLDEVKGIDLTIDGADEVDTNLNGIKGGGGALLYEKIVAENSNKVIWVVDSSKLVNKLGKFPLPVEVVQFGINSTINKFSERNLNPTLRLVDNKPFITDSGNFVVDLHLSEIDSAVRLNSEIKLITGVVETGLFLNLADLVIVGKESSAELIERPQF
jgi:ribose 5-phosphate isomerase A